MKSFVFQNAVKVFFGTDQLEKLGAELARYGKRVLMVYGGGSIKRIGLYDKVVAQIQAAGLELFELPGIEPNPRIESVREGARLCKEHGIDVVLAVGGGSTIDACKWIAAAACTDADPWDFFDRSINLQTTDALPLVDVLTVSATGSEMNNGGVISNFEKNEKLGAKSDHVWPKASFLDPSLTFTVNAFQTACGSFDIISHVMETYFAPDDPMYFLDTVSEGIMKTVVRYAPIAIAQPENYEARANLMWAASWAINGMIRADKTQVWSCHPIEHQLSAVYDITHGLGLAIVTPSWLRHCLTQDNAAKYAQFGINVFGIDASLPEMEIARQAIEALERFIREGLGLTQRLSDLGIDRTHFAAMAQRACASCGGTIKGFKELHEADVIDILERSL